MQKQRRNIVITVIILFAIVASVVGLFAYQQWKTHKQILDEFQATVLTPPRAVGPFMLKNKAGKIFSQSDLLGHYSLLFFGYTRCPDICPTTLSTLNQVLQQLRSQGITLPQVVFISLDPARDDTPYLQEYVHYFNPLFKGVTGTPAQIDALTRDLGIAFMKVNANGSLYQGKDKNYLVDHSGAVLLINQSGQLRAIFQMPHTSAQMSKELAFLLR
jgi:protein SCO1/2